MRALTFGHFRIVHAGHIHLFRLSKALVPGGQLIVAVAADAVVRAGKGRDPIFPVQDRLDIIKECRSVDGTIIYGEGLSADDLCGKSYAEHLAVLHPSEVSVCEVYKPDFVTFGDDKEASAYGHLEGLCGRLVQLPRLESRISSSAFISGVRESV